MQYLIVIVRILKAHIVELNPAFCHGKLLRIRRICDLDRSNHDLKKPFDSGHAPLELFRKFHDPPDRSDQC